MTSPRPSIADLCSGYEIVSRLIAAAEPDALAAGPVAREARDIWHLSQAHLRFAEERQQLPCVGEALAFYAQRDESSLVVPRPRRAGRARRRRSPPSPRRADAPRPTAPLPLLADRRAGIAAARRRMRNPMSFVRPRPRVVALDPKLGVDPDALRRVEEQEAADRARAAEAEARYRLNQARALMRNAYRESLKLRFGRTDDSVQDILNEDVLDDMLINHCTPIDDRNAIELLSPRRLMTQAALDDQAREIARFRANLSAKETGEAPPAEGSSSPPCGSAGGATSSEGAAP